MSVLDTGWHLEETPRSFLMISFQSHQSSTMVTITDKSLKKLLYNPHRHSFRLTASMCGSEMERAIEKITSQNATMMAAIAVETPVLRTV